MIYLSPTFCAPIILYTVIIPLFLLLAFPNGLEEHALHSDRPHDRHGYRCQLSLQSRNTSDPQESLWSNKYKNYNTFCDIIF